MSNKYETFPEAQAAAQALSIKNSTEYKTRYREDPRLPALPHQSYKADWVDWYHFFGAERPIKKYESLAQAQAAAQGMGIKTSKEYVERYREDPRLPSKPCQTYAADWVDWYHFFGMEWPIEKYESLAEAQAAAQALCIKTARTYTKRFREDPRLPSDPRRAYKDDWVGWCNFLGNERCYRSLSEAQAVAQALGIKTGIEYKKRFREHPRLPSKPERVYAEDWVDWYHFLGTERPIEFYESLAQAQAAAQGMGIKTSKEYAERYREDPLLPAVPEQVYEADWVDWYQFLDTERPVEKYESLAEAQTAAQSLGITTGIEYKACYWNDPRLPANPDRAYAENWVDWYQFLGKERCYESLSEAQAAVKMLGIKSASEYIRRYREDVRLPASPCRSYEVDWYQFLGTTRPIDSDLAINYPVFWEAIEAYVSEGTNQTSKTSHLRGFLQSIVANLNLPDHPGVLLSKDMPFPQKAYEGFVYATGDSQQRPRHNICASFLDWILETYCSDEDDEGMFFPFPGYRNPLRTILKGYLDHLPTYRLSESNKPPLPMESILRAKHHLIPGEAETFRDFYMLHPFLEDCWFEVDPALVDESDPDCIIRTVTKDRGKGTGKRYSEEVMELWSPVKVVANYALFSMPLRGQQILWLDSGEGDGIIPVWLDGKVCWITNTGPLARPKRNQGFLRRGQDGEPSSYITTNKTGRKEGGYSVPFMPEPLTYWVIKLREWQSKYNPIPELTPWTKIKLRAKTNEKVLENRGRQAFLFRDPASKACVDKVSPMFTTTAFTRTVPALLFHSQRPGEDLAEMFHKSKKSVDYKSPFTPHSLRV
ncbi:MAG: integrase, partial [Marinobacter sp.]|uniref:VPA1269 family protein n=1 Tax=Marinobacter sp. TaxID=50741 RepID=UPI001B4B1400